MWILAVPLLGVIPYTRYDLWVACAVALSLVLSGRSAYGSAALLSLAIALKLWPLVLLPLLVLRAKPSQRPGVLSAGLLPWLAIELAGALVWGARSITAPWDWQRDRGLQIEAIAAGPLRLLHSGSDLIRFRYNAWETTSPALALGVLALVGFALATFVLITAGRRLVRPDISRRQADDVVLTTATLLVGLLLVTGKVFSPQYLLWLLAPLAVSSFRPTRRDRWLLALVPTVCALTTLVYPVLYSQLIEDETVPWIILQVRNAIILVVVAILAARWRESIKTAPQDDPSPQRVEASS